MLWVLLVIVVLKCQICMLNNVADRTPPCVTECSVCFTSFDVVCDEFENDVRDVCLVQFMCE